MFAPFKIKVGARAIALAVALATSSFSAQAVLERVGPVNPAPSVGGYPAWYQDTTGVALEFCDPKNDAELAGGWCLLLPPDVGILPEVFPTHFFDEHFYYAAGAAATASLSDNVHGRALLVISQEGAFAVGPPIPGDQITFSRIRVSLSPLPAAGSYRFIHPYGEEVIEGTAGGRIFFTEDIGIACDGLFDCALRSRLGPFLKPSATVGGPEMPPLTQANQTPDIDPAHFAGLFAPTPYPNTGKAYLADPNRIGPVTGSVLPDFVDSTGALRNHNIFRIEGPAGSGLGVHPTTGLPVDWVETTDFQLMGRLFDGAIPGQAKIDRATYTRNANGLKVDVLATSGGATAARIPAQPAPAKIVPALTFFDAPCAGVVDAAGVTKPPFSAPIGATETQMFTAGTLNWGQVRPAVLPTAVCMKNGNARDSAGNIVPVYTQQAVTDEVTVTQSLYDSSAGTLSVAATSSDATLPPVLQVAYNGFLAPLVAGQITVPNVLVPPSTVVVESSARGFTESMVSTSNLVAATGAGVPVAVSDTVTIAEDSGPTVISILANDTNVAGGTVTITSAPSFGTAVLNAVTGTVTYTPKLNYNGTDSFTYTVTVGAQVSGFATVSLIITPVNDAPVAVNDTATVSVNTPIQINVLDNDTDPDGVTDLLNAVNISPSVPAGATITGGAGGIVTFQAPAQGTYRFTYRAQDRSLTTSANTGTVTVTVQAPQAIVFNKAQYTRSQSNLTATGNITPTPTGNPVVTFVFTNNAGTELGAAGTATVTAGKFNLNVILALPVGATRLKATTAAGAVATFALSIR